MHKHLTWTDRLKIEKALKEGLKPCKIADRLHVHNTTIYRELKRGTYTHLNSDLTTEERYSPEIAEARYRENLAAKGGELKIGSDYELAAFIEKKIGEEGFSPAAVLGEIKRLGLTFKTQISEKTIYNYIDKGIFYGISRESLPEKGKRKRKYEKVERKKAARTSAGESIEQRDPEVDERKTFGHWEGDCVCGKKKTKQALFVLSERLTRQEIIMKIPDGSRSPGSTSGRRAEGPPARPASSAAPARVSAPARYKGPQSCCPGGPRRPGCSGPRSGSHPAGYAAA